MLEPDRIPLRVHFVIFDLVTNPDVMPAKVHFYKKGAKKNALHEISRKLTHVVT